MDEPHIVGFARQHATRCGLLVAMLGLYVASIGPLAGMEAGGYGSHGVWRSLKPIYAPVFWSWKYGPDWWAHALKTYTRLFHRRKGCIAMQVYEFASNNDADAYRQGKLFRKGGFSASEL